MKWKNLFVVLCMIIFWNVTTFAENKTIEKQVNIRNGTLTFYTSSQEHNIDYMCSPELDIIIKENTAGILKDGDVIYFETSRNGEVYCVNEYLNIESKGVSVQEIDNQKDNHFAIRISRNDTKQAAEIKIHFSVFFPVNYDTENTFSLKLDTSRTKQNNLFSGKDEIVLNEQFLKIFSAHQRAQQKEKNKQKKVILSFSITEQTMTQNDIQKQLEYPIYINEKGISMISFNDYINIEQYFYKNGMSFADNGIAKYNTLLEFMKKDLLEKDTIKNSIFLQNTLEKKYDLYYISLRSIAEIWNIEHIDWDDNSKTITLWAEEYKEEIL